MRAALQTCENNREANSESGGEVWHFEGRKGLSDNVTSCRDANTRGRSTSLGLNYTYPAAASLFG